VSSSVARRHVRQRKAAAKKAEKERKKAKKAAAAAQGVEAAEKGKDGPAPKTAEEEITSGVEQVSLQTS
jgi:methionyl-tRNA synthetase